jgi:hypothetical protein
MGVSAYFYYDFNGLFNLNNLFGRLQLEAQQLHCVANQPIRKTIVAHTQDLTNIVFTPSVNYSIARLKNLEVYAGAGVGVNFNVSSKGAPWNFGDTVYNSSGTPIYTILGGNIENHKVKPSWASLNIHAGIILSNRLDFNIQYVPSSITSEFNSNGSSKMQILSLRANYVFRPYSASAAKKVRNT